MQGFQHILTIGEGFNKYKLACGLTNRREVGIQIIDAIMQGDLIVGFKTILFSAHLRWEFLWPIFRAWLGTKRKTLVEWWCGKGIEKTADDWHSPSEESIVEVNLQSGPPFLSPFIELSLCFFPPCIHIYIHYTVFIYIERERERERLRILHAKTSPEGAAPLHWKGSPMPFSVWSALEPFQERLQPTWQRCFCQFGWALSYGFATWEIY